MKHITAADGLDCTIPLVPLYTAESTCSPTRSLVLLGPVIFCVECCFIRFSCVDSRTPVGCHVIKSLQSMYIKGGINSRRSGTQFSLDISEPYLQNGIPSILAKYGASQCTSTTNGDIVHYSDLKRIPLLLSLLPIKAYSFLYVLSLPQQRCCQYSSNTRSL